MLILFFYFILITVTTNISQKAIPMKKLILASGSPRRKELLKQIGLEFEIIVAKGEEVISSHFPDKVVEELSLQKASEIASLARFENSGDIILGSDTVVAIQDRIMGKPKNTEDAFAMLNDLQGKTHTVYTGVTFIITDPTPKIITFSEATHVSMYPMSHSEIKSYIATGEPMDKAGAYAIQGRCAAFISKIDGEYNTVVGLPVARVYQELKPYLSLSII